MTSVTSVKITWALLGLIKSFAPRNHRRLKRAPAAAHYGNAAHRRCRGRWRNLTTLDRSTLKLSRNRVNGAIGSRVKKSSTGRRGTYWTYPRTSWLSPTFRFWTRIIRKRGTFTGKKWNWWGRSDWKNGDFPTGTNHVNLFSWVTLTIFSVRTCQWIMTVFLSRDSLECGKYVKKI